MKSRGARVCLLTSVFAVSFAACSSSSKQVDAGSPEDAALSDAGADRISDAFVPGKDAGKDTSKDTTPTGTPDVPPLCPGIDPWGYDRPFEPGPTPFPDGIELVVGSGEPTMMRVTDSELYWATAKTIHRLSLSDRTDKVLLDRSAVDNHLNDFTVDGATLYIAEGGLYNPYRVAKMPLDGSSGPVTLGGNISPWYVAVEGGYVYFYDANIAEIDRVPIAGGSVTALVGKVYPDNFLLANGHIYFTSQVTPIQDSLLAIPLDAQVGSTDAGVDGGSGGLQTLASNNVGIGGPCYDGGYVYYLDGGNLMKMPAAGGAPTAFQTQQGPLAGGALGIGGGHIYWISGNQTCPNIMRAKMDGSGQTVLVHSLQDPRRFAVNATHLFILTGSKQILRVAR